MHCLTDGEAPSFAPNLPACNKTALTASRIADQNLISSPSAILPFLFVGDEADGCDFVRLRCLGIGHILNVTAHLQSPVLTTEATGFQYKRLPATDSCRQNILQYFGDAFDFIGELIDTREELERSEESCNASVKRLAAQRGEGQPINDVFA